MTVRVVLLVPLHSRCSGGVCRRNHRSACSARDLAVAGGRPRGAVSTFCSEHGISPKSFYELRKRVKADGPAAVLEPRSRRPRSTPELTDQVKTEAVQCVRLWRRPGWTTGRSVRTTRCTRWDCEVDPSVASLAWIFREAGVARLEPEKKPRSAWRRFV